MDNMEIAISLIGLLIAVAGWIIRKIMLFETRVTALETEAANRQIMRAEDRELSLTRHTEVLKRFASIEKHLRGI